MGKGKKLKSSSVTADFEKFENFFYQDSHMFRIITCIADSMSKSGLSFIHYDRDTSELANNVISEYEIHILVSELIVANILLETNSLYLTRRNQILSTSSVGRGCHRGGGDVWHDDLIG